MWDLPTIERKNEELVAETRRKVALHPITKQLAEALRDALDQADYKYNAYTGRELALAALKAYDDALEGKVSE